jgi:hypothetical protein
LAILASAASCKLPLGNPNFNISFALSFFIPGAVTLETGPGIIPAGHLRARHWIDFPRLAR